MNPHEELFHRLLDESSSLLTAPEGAGIAIPDDELHREIIVPLLPAMLGDAAIRGHWNEQHATGFVARIGRHFENGDPAPRWTPGDFEIHVTASYSAGADARALADTLLSEESLRDMTAALMNQLLDTLWPSLAPAPVAVPAVPELANEVSPMEISDAEIPAPEITEPIEPALEVPEPALSTERTPGPEPMPELVPASEPEPGIAPAISPSAIGPEYAEEIQTAVFLAARGVPSRTLIRALCRKIAASDLQRGIAANSSQPGAGAAITARRIISRNARARRPQQSG